MSDDETFDVELALRVGKRYTLLLLAHPTQRQEVFAELSYELRDLDSDTRGAVMMVIHEHLLASIDDLIEQHPNRETYRQSIADQLEIAELPETTGDSTG